MSDRVLLGFDFGTKRIGVALGQELLQAARPLTTIVRKNKQADWQAIGTQIDEWQPQALVVGVPVQEDDSEQKMTRLARKFCNQLRGRFNLEVYEAEERFSSIAAEMAIRERRSQGAKKGSLGVDAVAAVEILESWLRANNRADDQ